MTKPKILLLGEIDHAHASWNALSSIAEIVTPRSTCREDFIAECQTPHLNDVLIAYRTFTSVSITGLWDEPLIAALPRSLRFCAHNGAGYDQIDIAACSAREPPLRVSNVPSAVDDATADTAVFLILGALRNFNSRENDWDFGHGGIGRNMKAKTDVFGFSTIYHNRSPLSERLAAGAEYVSFEELLARSDVLSLNLPLNPKTHHIISTPEFAKMKRGVIIINTARGAIIDENALVQALESGQVRSCGLDVFEDEPRVHPGLIGNPNVVLLPHMGTWTVETQTAMEEWCISNVRTVLEQGKLKSPVPEQIDL